MRDALDAGHKNLNAIPETDRREFIDTWDAGRKKESYKILDRPSFAPSVAVSAEIVPAEVIGKTKGGNAVIKNEMNAEKLDGQKVQEKADRQDLKLDDLGDISLAEADIKPPLSNHKKPGAAVIRGQ